MKRHRKRRQRNDARWQSQAARGLAWLLLASGSGVILIGQAGRVFPTADLVNSIAPMAVAALLLGSLVLVKSARRIALIGIALAVFGFVDRVLPEFTRDTASASASKRDVIIVTHNVWRENADPARTVDTILAANPDVVMLQEVSPQFLPVLGRLRDRLPHVSRCPRAPCPLMIFSRWPTGDGGWRFRNTAGRGIGPNLIHLRILPPDRPAFTVASLHLPRSFEDAAGMSAIRESLPPAVQQVRDSRLIIAGDFNLTPWAFAMNRLDDAMTPMARVATSQPTYPGNAWVPVLPIDHVYAGPGWLTVSTARLPSSGSDHRGVIVRLQPLP